MSQVRESLNIVVVGHVDHGKSTLIGRLLYDTNALPEGAIEKVEKLSKEKGKNFEYAFLLDAFEEEQQQGITIDTTRLQFATEKRDFVIIDAPGHKEFLKNMISGAASAEAAFLMVDAHEGIKEQSKRHGYLLSLLGIKKVYVVVNKMDLVDYSEERFNRIREDFNVFLNNLHIFPEKYIPVAALLGENIASKSKNMVWYKGLSVLETMDAIPKENDLLNKPLRFSIQDVYKFDHRRIIVGNIDSGILKVGDEIQIAPIQKITKVKSIETWGSEERLTEVSAGMAVGITVEDEFFNKRGEVITHREEGIQVGNFFNANLFWMGKNKLVKNKAYKLKLGTQAIEAEVFAINKVIDASTLTEAEDVSEVSKNDVAQVTLKTKEVICYDEFSKYPNTGRFVLVDELDVSGGGIISGVDDTLKNRKLETKSYNIAPRKKLVSRQTREEAYKQKAKVIWLTGLPGCGKNEVAIKLEKKLFEQGKKVYYLDSSNIRFGLSSDLTFTKEDAKEQTRRLAETANLMVDSGHITLVTSVSRFQEDRVLAREIIGTSDYIEIFVEATEEVCQKRRPKTVVEQEQSLIYEKSDYPVITLYIDDPTFNSDAKITELIKLLGI